MNRRLTLKQLPMQDRPRERLIDQGPGSLSDAELLAILLRTGTDRDTAVQLAHRLLMTESGGAGPGLRFLATATIEELMKIRGVGPVKAAQIKAAVELGRRLAASAVDRRSITGPADIAGMVMEDMRHLDREQFRVILLNTKNHVLAVELVSIGGLNSSPVHPREIFKQALRRSAAAVILVHNHPSGDPAPSDEDVNVTRRLQRAGELLGIAVLDHIVIGDGRFISLRQRGDITGPR